MANLEKVLDAALAFTLAEEGGWSNHPADRGGATNYGITLAVYKGLGRDGDLDGDGDVDADDLRRMTQEKAREIYRRNYWPFNAENVKPLAEMTDPRVLIKVFDTGVNMGPKVAIRLLQEAVSSLGAGKTVAVDSVLGPQTMSAVLGIPADRLLQRYAALQLQRYDGIVLQNPSQRAFIKGWTKRANRLPEWKEGHVHTS